MDNHHTYTHEHTRIQINLSHALRFSSQNMNSNIKRENKLYSYEDQLAEIELKKVSLDVVLVMNMIDIILLTITFSINRSSKNTATDENNDANRS